MSRVSRKTPWWRRMLKRWWMVESVCCLWARPVMTRTAYACRWCGREMWLRDWDDFATVRRDSALYWKRVLYDQEADGIVGGQLSKAQAERFRRHLIERSVLKPRVGDR